MVVNISDGQATVDLEVESWGLVLKFSWLTNLLSPATSDLDATNSWDKLGPAQVDKILLTFWKCLLFMHKSLLFAKYSFGNICFKKVGFSKKIKKMIDILRHYSSSGHQVQQILTPRYLWSIWPFHHMFCVIFNPPGWKPYWPEGCEAWRKWGIGFRSHLVSSSVIYRGSMETPKMHL